MPGDLKRFSYPKHMSVPYIPTRAKPSINSVAANAKRKGGSGREWGTPQIPKKEIRSSARDELAMIRLKIEHCQLNFHPLSGLVSGALSIAIYSPISRILRPASVDRPRFVSLTSPSTVLVQSTRPRRTWPDLREALRRTNSRTT